MDYVAQVFAVVMLCLLIWTVMASPVLAAFYFLARTMRRRSIRSPWSIALFALAFAFLAAPVPTPIITVFTPHVVALMDGSYYDRILHGPVMFAGLWPWIVTSLVLTFAVSLVLAWRYLRPANVSPAWASTR